MAVAMVMMTTFVVEPFYLCQGLQRSPRQTSLVLTVWRQVAAFSGMYAERLYLQVMWLA